MDILMTLKTYIIKYKDNNGHGWTGQAHAFDVRQAMSSFFELNPQCKQIISCMPWSPDW